VVLFTSDRGLCGAFNMNLIQRAERFMEEEKDRAIEMAVSFVGRKGRDYFRKRKVNIRREYVNLLGKVDYALAARIGQELVQAYMENQVDAIYLLYSEFKSAMQQRICLERVLPVIPETSGPPEEGRAQEAASDRAPSAVEYIYEPSESHILDKLLPMYVECRFTAPYWNLWPPSMAPRMTAMENATNNAAEMIEKLTMIYTRLDRLRSPRS